MPAARAAKPTLGSGRANLAFSAAMIMSQASAISNPPPMAKPFTAAITGLYRSYREVRPPNPVAGIGTGDFWPDAANLRSLPAEKAFSPAPVTIATHKSGLLWNSSNTRPISAFPMGWRQFSWSGRLMVTTKTRPSVSVLMNSYVICGPPVYLSRSCLPLELTAIRGLRNTLSR